MSREEARKRLAGTFGFEMQDGMVVVRDESLLEEIRILSTEPAAWATHRSGRSAPARSSSHGYVVRA